MVEQEELLPVIQDDRQAAAAWLREEDYWHVDRDAFLKGEKDDTPLVQSFAAHRLRHSTDFERGLEAGAKGMDTAPKDGTMVWLLVDYRDMHSAEGDADHPLADAQLAWTIGFNEFDDTGTDEWKFAGWCWTHDHFTEGRGKPVGWKPIGFELGADNDPIALALIPPVKP